ncbi:MAG: LacI family DNA-binding transcriptional regulator [Acidimicrobiales bacterium]
MPNGELPTSLHDGTPVNRLGPAERRNSSSSGADHTSAKRRVTIREVANLAQVSLGTVSNVLNNPVVVAPATRKRVLDAIDSTRFVRNTAAHQLRVGKSRTIGVVLLDIANPFFTEIVRGAEHVLREQDYALMLCSTDESAKREQRYFRVLEEHRVDGILVCPVDSDLESAVALVASGIPTVLLDRDGSSHGLCSAAVDDIRGAELAADHLFELGHQAVALVNGPATIRQCIDRKEGARRSVQRARCRSASLQEIVVGALTIDQGEGAVPALLAGEPRPSAVMCANDLLAFGVLRGLAAAGVAVPEEMAVVGYDDVVFASMLSPSLSSVRQPKYELGVAAAELLLEEVTGAPHEHRAIRFEPELVVRASSTPRPVSAPPIS